MCCSFKSLLFQSWLKTGVLNVKKIVAKPNMELFRNTQKSFYKFSPLSLIFVTLSFFPFVFSGSSVQNGDHNAINSKESSLKDDAYESFRQITGGDTLLQSRLFNTSIAVTVPLFSFSLPQTATQGAVADLANQVIFGLFSFLIIVLVFAFPVLFTGTTTSTGRSSDGSQNQDRILDRLLNKDQMMNLMGSDVGAKIGVNPTKCLKKTICEAHRSPRKYGLLATPFTIFFPPPVEGTPEARASSFQLAAKDGAYTNENCGKLYKCFFDVLDLGNYLIDIWNFNNEARHTS